MLIGAGDAEGEGGSGISGWFRELGGGAEKTRQRLGDESRVIRVENSVASSLPFSGQRLCFSQLCTGSARWVDLNTLLF